MTDKKPAAPIVRGWDLGLDKSKEFIFFVEQYRFVDADEQRQEDLMQPIILESPYAGDVKRNVAYARACVRDALRRGEAPMASHLLYTQEGILDDLDPAERALGIKAGHAWLSACGKVVMYVDLGISPGMLEGVRAAQAAGWAVESRVLFSQTELEVFLGSWR